MYSAPWARLTRFMMPNTSVSPAASRNSITPSCSPFRVCSAMRTKSIKKKGRAAPPRRPPALLPLHLAVLGIGVLVGREHRLLNFHHRIRRRSGARDRLQQVEVLDREMVVVVAELAARGLEIRLAHGRDRKSTRLNS